MFVVCAEWVIRDGHEDEVVETLREIIPIFNAEPGCALYVVNRSLEEPRTLLFYEQYHDRAGFDAHVESDVFKAQVLGRLVPMLERRDRAFYEVLEPEASRPAE